MATKSSWADESEDLLDTPTPQTTTTTTRGQSSSYSSSSSSSSSSSYSSQRQSNNNYSDSTGRDRERTSNNYYNNRDRQDYNSRESHPSHYNNSNHRDNNYNRTTSSTEDYNSSRGSRGDYNNSRGNESRFEYQSSRGDYNRDREDRGGYSSQRRNNDGNRNYRNNNSNSINGGAPREPIPLPESAPFIAFVGNLSYNSSNEDIQAFFEEHGCKSINVRLLINKDTGKPKGFGYVEFEDLETLKKAIDLSGQVLQERPIKVDVSKPDDGKRREYNKPRTSEPSSETVEATETTETSERKKLVLNPRGTTTPAEPHEAYKGPENPFGHAKPRDENQILSKIEEHRKQRGGSAEPEPVKKEDKPRPQRESRDYHDKSKRDNRGRDDRFKKDDKGRRDDRSNNKEERPRIKREEKVNEPSQVKNQNPFAALREEDE